MEISITAEFESADKADLAIMRINKFPGIKSCDIINNHCAETLHEHESRFFSVAAPIASGSSYPGSANPGLSGYLLYGNLDGNSDLDRIEPAQRRDVRLLVICDNEGAAHRVSSTLRNLGGLDIQISSRAAHESR